MIRLAISKLRSEGIIGLWDAVATRFRHSRSAFKMYRMGILSHDTIYGSDYYVHRDQEAAIQDAETFAKAVIGTYNPKSVLELGCGTGRLLYPYKERGIHVHGIDLSQTAQNVSRLSESEFEQHDLTQPYSTERHYDLVLCVEVLEHIPKNAADTIINSISNAGDTAIVTAAPPGQGGTHHVNEQPPGYWIEKFESQGMSYQESQSLKFKKELEMEELSWIEKNLLVFKS